MMDLGGRASAVANWVLLSEYTATDETVVRNTERQERMSPFKF